MNDLAGKHIVLGLTGGIACYKAAELCRALIKEGATVQVVMTEAAEQFITPVTMQALSGRPVYSSQWDAREPNNMPHINLSREADAILRRALQRRLHGQAGARARRRTAVSLMCLARPIDRVPLLIAPAMNREMWAHPGDPAQHGAARAPTARTILGVGSGFQACGETGDGRMLEPPRAAARTSSRSSSPSCWPASGCWSRPGRPSRRSTRSAASPTIPSGKMGFAIARAAREAGAEVTLVAGPVSLPTPRGVHAHRREVGARHARRRRMPQAPRRDVFVATAAVADWRPADAQRAEDQEGRQRRARRRCLHREPRHPRDGRAGRARQAGALFCVGFAAESHDLREARQAKRERKGIPLLVGNIGPPTFGQDDNQLLLVDAHGVQELPRAPKLDLARQLVAEIARACLAPRA